MTRQTAQRAIDEASRLKAEWISFSGGEPFLEYDLLKELIEVSSGKGLKTEVVSNGSWGQTREEAHTILKPLIESGLDVLNLSIDDFHSEFIPFESVMNAYWAAIDLGLKIVLMVSTGKDSKITSESLPELLGDDRIQVVGKSRIPNSNSVLFETQFTPARRGAGLKYDPVLFSEMKCSDVLKDIGVAPNGAVMPCCGPLGTKTILGNVKDEGLDVILDRAVRNPRYQRIREGFKVNGRYSSRCHACVEN